MNSSSLPAWCGPELAKRWNEKANGGAMIAEVKLTKAELSTLHGWSNFVKFSPDGGWDDDDEALRLRIYEVLLPLIRKEG